MMEHKDFMREAAKVARLATCKRAKCGSIIVKDNATIGTGFNSPAGNLESQRRCDIDKEKLHKKVTDKTCCMHAEQRAIFDALRNNPDKLPGSTLYFVRLDKDGQIEKAGKPYCTICSKMALDVGIRSFVLWHEAGIKVYDMQEYNLISLGYAE